jgi:hypothetical protein
MDACDGGENDRDFGRLSPEPGRQLVPVDVSELHGLQFVAEEFAVDVPVVEGDNAREKAGGMAGKVPSSCRAKNSSIDAGML